MNLEVFREQDTVWIRDTDTQDEWPLPADVWDGATGPIGTLIAAVEPLMDREYVSPYLSAWEFESFRMDLDGEDIHKRLTVAYENARKWFPSV